MIHVTKFLRQIKNYTLIWNKVEVVFPYTNQSLLTKKRNDKFYFVFLSLILYELSKLIQLQLWETQDL